MKRLLTGLVALAALAVLTNTACAQPPKGKDDKGKEPPKGGKFGFPPNPLLKALDTDGDGTLSAEEIKGASAALLKLDKNKDGKLTAEELRPEGFGKGPFGGKPGDPKAFQERIKALDKDKNGKVSNDELPPFLQKLLEKYDANNDGALDESEIQKISPPAFGPGGKGGPGDKGGKELKKGTPPAK